MSLKEFRLPDLGEGLTEAELVTWKVSIGDEIKLNEIIAEVETAKALVALPSPFPGTVVALLCEEGETIPVGKPIIEIKTGAPEPVLVGYGPSDETSQTHRRPNAKPAARKLARELGLNIAEVSGSGLNGTVTTADVREVRTPVNGVRKATATAMSTSATLPQVTVMVTIDVTESMKLIDQLRAAIDFATIHVTPLSLVAHLAVKLLAQHPMLNSAWVDSTQEIIRKNYVNLGIAVASPRGLLVPSVKGAEKLSFAELCTAIAANNELARSGAATPADLTGSTFSITNIGVFGVDTGTPLLNPGEAAILALGAVSKRPWVVDDQIVVRSIVTLGLSFDHRLVDGEQGSKFLRDLGAALENPLPALMR